MSPHYLRLPRNYNFLSRLPESFELEVIKKGNSTTDGTWYLTRISNHEINILSKVNLIEGSFYHIRKKDYLTLELGPPVDSLNQNSSSDLDYFG